MKCLVTWRLIHRLLIWPIVGLLLCRLVDFIICSGKQHIDQTTVGLAILQLMAGIFGGTAIILVPLRIFWDRHDVRETANYLAETGFDPETLPLVQRHLFYMNYGHLPKWLYLPFVIFAMVLVGVFALGIAAFILLCVVWVILYLYVHLFGV
jgi:hypothetical protein